MTALPGTTAQAVAAPPSSTPTRLDKKTPAKPDRLPAWWLDPVLRHQLVPSFAFGICAAAVVSGTLSLSLNSLDFMRLPLTFLMTIALVLLVLYGHRETSVWDRGTIALAVLSLASGIFLVFWDEWFYGFDINGVIHRSLFLSVALLIVGLPAMCNALFWVLGGTPTAWDTSRYPLLLYPILLVLFIYGALLWKLFAEGAPGLGWDIIETPYDVDLQSGSFEKTPGLRNHILGTLLLVGMTAAFALPVGVGAGVCIAENEGWLATIIGFCTKMLRAISVFILAVIAFSIVDWSTGFPVGTWQSDFFRGYYKDDGGFNNAGHGSYLTASLVLSLLVIPVIARATEEGFRSIPRDIREGSVALGATEGHAFLFLMLPWAIPNIITGLLLGCAEAAGSVAVLLFIARSGEFGVGPLQEVTSLGYLVYYVDRGAPGDFQEVMKQYQYTAGLLLLFITLGLSIAAVVLKQKFGARYRGADANQ